MIDAIELRIGNLVRIETHDIDYEGNKYTEWDYVTVRSISSEGINLFIANQHIEPDDFVSDIQGVPLTASVLEKLGCKKIGADDFHTDVLWSLPAGQYDQYQYCEGGFIVDNSGYYGHYCNIGTGIIYLHRLQNLYFALTGKELEYKQ